MTSQTVGFAIGREDQERLERLVRKFAQGNRSAFLRVAMDHMEAVDRAERLRALQQYGAARSTGRGVTLADVERIVDRVLAKSKKT